MLSAQLDGLHRQFNRGVSCHDDDRNGSVGSPQARQDFEYVSVWQVVVQNGGIWPGGGIDFFGLAAGSACNYLKPSVLQERLDCGEKVGLVVYNQNATIGHDCT